MKEQYIYDPSLTKRLYKGIATHNQEQVRCIAELLKSNGGVIGYVAPTELYIRNGKHFICDAHKLQETTELYIDTEIEKIDDRYAWHCDGCWQAFKE